LNLVLFALRRKKKFYAVSLIIYSGDVCPGCERLSACIYVSQKKKVAGDLAPLVVFARQVVHFILYCPRWALVHAYSPVNQTGPIFPSEWPPQGTFGPLHYVPGSNDQQRSDREELMA
jgi:hypothetical protein